MNALDRMTSALIAELNPAERAILERRFATHRASWRGRLELIARARGDRALEAPISARDRHRIRRLFLPLVRSLRARARAFSRKRLRGFDYLRSSVELVARAGGR